MRLRVPVAILVAAAVAFAVASSLAAPRQPVEVKATLMGEVLAEGLVKPGDGVAEGEPLLYVRTATGRAVAARATVDGRVLEVLVSAGTVIRELGTVVVRLEPR